MKTIRIFISSPGDVSEEREKARQVISALQRRYDDCAQLIPVLWEDLAIPATASFQQGIDFVLSERNRVEIAIFILWSRLGSPLGPAITKRDGSAYASGTEREFDLMLAAFEQSGGKLPLILAYTRSDDEGFSKRLDARAHGDEALEEMLKQRKLVRQFIRERFQDEQGRNVRAFHSYREPVSFAQRLNVHLRDAIDALLDQDSAGATWTEAPYRSLEVFDIQHSPIFCGRDDEICNLLERLRDQETEGCGYVCIVGASGSGKSSLARAGVAATLIQRSFDDGVKKWRAAIFVPELSSGNLFLAVARALAGQIPELNDGVGGIERFAQRLEDNFQAAADLLETAFKAAGEALDGSIRLLLVLDQMEELWTDREITQDQREKFLMSVEALARTRLITVLATLRSDFYPRAQLSEVFLRMKGERGHFDLTPPGTTALQELIVRPAHRAGLHFERDERTNHTLDQRILEDGARGSSSLPLLQYALAELYELRDKDQRLLTFGAYEAMNGVEGALSKRAAQTFDGLPAEAQEAFCQVLPLLVSVDVVGDHNAVRRRAPFADLTCTPARALLTERLILARFLTTDVQDNIPIASLAHEALLRRWDRITQWIKTNREFLLARAHIEQNAATWELKGRHSDYLLAAGRSLEEAEDILRQQPAALSESGRAYVEASVLAVKEAVADKARERQRAALRQSKRAEELWENYKETGNEHNEEWRFASLAEIESDLVNALALDPELVAASSLLIGIRRLLVEAGIKTRDLNLASVYLQKLKTMAGTENASPQDLGKDLDRAWAEVDPARNKQVLSTRKWAFRGCWMPLLWLAAALVLAVTVWKDDGVSTYLLISGAVGTIMNFVVALYVVSMASGQQSAGNHARVATIVNIVASLAGLNLVSLVISGMIFHLLGKVGMQKLFWPKAILEKRKPSS